MPGRVYLHMHCGRETAVDGPPLAALLDPRAQVNATYCVACGQMDALDRFVWADTRATIAMTRMMAPPPAPPPSTPSFAPRSYVPSAPPAPPPSTPSAAPRSYVPSAPPKSIAPTQAPTQAPPLTAGRDGALEATVLVIGDGATSLLRAVLVRIAPPGTRLENISPAGQPPVHVVPYAVDPVRGRPARLVLLGLDDDPRHVAGLPARLRTAHGIIAVSKSATAKVLLSVVDRHFDAVRIPCAVVGPVSFAKAWRAKRSLAHLCDTDVTLFPALKHIAQAIYPP